MRILNLERFENFSNDSRAVICLNANEIHKLHEILYKEGKKEDCKEIVQGLDKDFFLLDSLVSHGNIDKSDAEIILSKLSRKEKDSKNDVEVVEIEDNDNG